MSVPPSHTQSSQASWADACSLLSDATNPSYASCVGFTVKDCPALACLAIKELLRGCRSKTGDAKSKKAKGQQGTAVADDAAPIPTSTVADALPSAKHKKKEAQKVCNKFCFCP